MHEKKGRREGGREVRREEGRERRRKGGKEGRKEEIYPYTDQGSTLKCQGLIPEEEV